MDYKSSIRLPKTSFPMKANLKSTEVNILQYWSDINLHSKFAEQNKGKQDFVIHDGPPYANGSIHIGTTLNKILKDFIIKGKSALGYHVRPIVFGWDCHGLPIEWTIEEQLRAKKLNKDSISTADFRRQCREFAAKWIEVQRKDFYNLGVMGDLNRSYYTMDYKSQSIIAKKLFEFLTNDNIYLGKKPILWSPIEQTALSEAEVEYKDKISDSVYVGFKIVSTSDSSLVDAYALVWTTTPWTLPANQALAYNKEFKYSAYEVISVHNDNGWLKVGTKLVFANELLSSVCENLQIEVRHYKDVDLNDIQNVRHPLADLGYREDIELLYGEFVTNDAGTGIVHIAPSHGEDDFTLGKKYNLDTSLFISGNGVYNSKALSFEGVHIFKANPIVIEKLAECKTIFAHSTLKHSYPHSWRSKGPLIYYLTAQWFINIDKEKQNVLNTIDNDINFHPTISKNRLRSMVSNRPDWCISRQRKWGVPLPFFLHTETMEVLKDDSINAQIVKDFAEHGADIWYTKDPLTYLEGKYPKEQYQAVQDVVDVWFDSGVSHAFVLDEFEGLRSPADVYIEGTDQHRGWFQSSLITSVLSKQQAPYKNLITHGFVIDAKGQKMSKSLGNVVAPKEVIEKFGRDIMRLWVANTNYHEDVRISDDILNQQIDRYKKIRNTIRFMLGNINDDIDVTNIKYNELEELEQWMLHKISEIHAQFVHCMDKSYQFNKFLNVLYEFLAFDVSAFYFDIRKDVLYCDSLKSNRYISSQYMLKLLFDYTVKWLSAFTSFTAEEAFLLRWNKTKPSVMLEDMPKVESYYHNSELNDKWQNVINIRSVVNSALEVQRNNKEIKSSLETEIKIYLADDVLLQIKDLPWDDICIVSNVQLYSITSVDTSNCFVLESNANIAVMVEKYQGEKCPRCWKYNNLNNVDHKCKRCDEYTAEV